MLQPLKVTTPEFSTPVQYCESAAPLVPGARGDRERHRGQVGGDDVARGVLDGDGGLGAEGDAGVSPARLLHEHELVGGAADGDRRRVGVVDDEVVRVALPDELVMVMVIHCGEFGTHWLTFGEKTEPVQYCTLVTCAV